MIGSTTGHLLIASLLGTLLTTGVKAQSLRNGVAPGENRSLYSIEPIESVTCHLSAMDVQLEDGGGERVYACTLNDTENPLGGLMYSIDLSEDFITNNRDCIMNGDCYVDVQGAITNESGAIPTIDIPEGAAMSVVDKSQVYSDRRELAVTGSRAVLVVRVKGKDKSCTPSSSELAGSIFGSGSDSLVNNMNAQYIRCSQEQLSFEPVTGNKVKQGILDVSIGKNISGTSIFSLTNAMFKAADKIVSSSLNKTPQHIMYVVPYGTDFRGSQGWVAFAHVSGFNSWYNDSWGNRLSAQVHEIGHNLGMQHSNENGRAYGDQSCMMGFSYGETNGPLMCFNAFKQHEFGWYSSQEEYVNGSNVWTGELIAFVDATKDRAKPVIINVGQTHMQLNSKKSFNSGTKENGDSVVLVEGTQADKESDKVGALTNPGDKITFNYGDMVAELCSINLGGDIDTARLSIYPSNQSSGCNIPSPSMPAPTPAPRSSGISIDHLKFVNTDTNEEVSSECSECLGDTANLGVVAEYSGDVQSVQFILTGDSSRTHTENSLPYSLFGDSGWNRINPGNLPLGSYTLACTGYSQKNLRGEASDTKTVNFVIA